MRCLTRFCEAHWSVEPFASRQGADECVRPTESNLPNKNSLGPEAGFALE
jgi:hypothetical protein